MAPPADLARLRVPAAGRKTKRSTRWETPAEWKARLGDNKWAELMKWCEEHRWHPHQLRHAAGSRLRKEFGVEAAQVVLGQPAVPRESYPLLRFSLRCPSRECGTRTRYRDFGRMAIDLVESSAR